MSLIDGFLEVPPMLLQEEHYLMNKCKTVEILIVVHLKAAYAETFEMQYDLTNFVTSACLMQFLLFIFAAAPLQLKNKSFLACLPFEEQKQHLF